jgi:hypothetical protein
LTDALRAKILMLVQETLGLTESAVAETVLRPKPFQEQDMLNLGLLAGETEAAVLELQGVKISITDDELLGVNNVADLMSVAEGKLAAAV